MGIVVYMMNSGGALTSTRQGREVIIAFDTERATWKVGLKHLNQFGTEWWIPNHDGDQVVMVSSVKIPFNCPNKQSDSETW